MDRCSEFQTQMLDLVYDLLDADESEQLRAHLDVCPSCQSALRQAQGQQQLLAAAARLEFPAVHFNAPAPQTEAAPASIPMPARPGRRPAWRRWVAAAALLAAVAIPAALGLDYADARGELAGHRETVARLGREQEEINRKAAKLGQQAQEKFASRREEVLARHHILVASGPASAVAGGLNEYQFHLRDGNNQPVRGKLQEVKVVDRERGDKVVFVAKDLSINGTLRLTLPQSLETAPHSRLTLYARASSQEGADSVLAEEFLLTPATYLTHLATDKPMYQPGETVRFRSLSLERFSLQPASERLSIRYTITTPQSGSFEIPQGDFNAMFRQGPGQGAAVIATSNKMLRGIGGGEWDIPAHLDGGEYILTVSEDNSRFPAQQRKFLVNKFQKPRLLKELVFNRRSYGPGDEVQAACTVKLGKDPVARCKAEASVQIDGKTYDADGNESAKSFALHTDAEGKVVVRFKLPKQIERGQASVNVNFFDGGKPEPLLKPIPVVLKKLDVEFYPEGGYLVPHVPCRVYFQARTTLGKPAELQGRLMDDTGDVVALTETLADDKEPGVNQGMGVFRFTPRPNRKYHLELDRPAGVTAHYPLKLEPWGVVAMSIPQAVTMSHEPIEVNLRSAEKPRQLLVGAYCRGRMFDHVRVTAPAGQDVKVTLNPVHGIGGVYRVTVFEEEPAAGQRPRLTPVAERLIFRQQRERLNLDVAFARKAEAGSLASATSSPQANSRAAGKSSIPGERVGLRVSALGENQEPIPAVVMVSAVDQSILKLADEKTARSMPTHFFLASEVAKPEELEFADFLLTTHPKAAPALDLLLGTQGWRRFAEQKPGEVREKLAEQAQALALLMTPVDVPRVTAALGLNEEKRSLAAKLQAEADKIESELASERRQLEASQADLSKKQELASTEPEHRAAAMRVEKYIFWLAYWPVFALFLIGTGVVLACRGLAEPMRKALPYFTGAAACAVPAILLTVLAFSTRVEREQRAQQSWVYKLSAKQWERLNIPNDEQPLGLDWNGAVEEKQPKADPGFAMPEKIAGGFGPRPQDQPAPPMAAPGMGGPRAPMPGGGWNQARGLKGGGAGGDAKAGLALKENQPDAFMMQFQGEGKALLARDKAKEGGKRDERENERKDLDPSKDGAAKKQLDNALKRRRQLDQLRDGKEDRNGDPALFFIREYAHALGDKDDKGVRSDMTDTVYWHPALVLPDGNIDVWFTLNDAVTAYQVTVFGHTLDGRVAAAKPFIFDARLPLALDSTTPLQVTASDNIIVPLTVANNTGQDRDVTLRLKELDGLKRLEKEPKTSAPAEPKKPGAAPAPEVLSIKSYSTGRRFYQFTPLSQGQARLQFEGLSKPHEDRLERTFEVVPEGFPISGAVSDLLEGGQARHEITLPPTWIRGTLQMRLQAFPSTLADLQSGLEGLLREPYGCFEQASTTNYPNVLILSYLKEADQAKPELERRVRELMERGYQKLTSYECQQQSGSKREGYEWFGGTVPPHEALTAYGLLQFRDMARHHEVDRAMLERTRKYLLARRDGKGGFERNPRALDSFGRAPNHVTDAYIVWALTESAPGEDLKRETETLVEKAKTSKDPYFLALTANCLINQAKTAQAVPLLKKVAEMQKDGAVVGAETSITGSGGRDLQIETTALALLAWIKADPGQFAAPIDQAAKWIGKQRGGHGAFGSTQSTILALKALIAHTKQTKRPRDDGELKLFVNGQMCGELAFKASASEALAIGAVDVENHLRAGKNTVRIVLTGKNQFPYSLGWTYQTLTPPSDAGCAVKLAASLSKTKVGEGDSVRMTVKLENASAQGQGMAVAIVGLPGGLNLPEDFKQLLAHKELPKDGSRPLISTFEVRGRELILYWRDLAPNQKIEVPIDLTCRVPGDYSGPASRAYLYYNADRKTWIEPLRISIAPRKE